MVIKEFVVSKILSFIGVFVLAAMVVLCTISFFTEVNNKAEIKSNQVVAQLKF